MYSDTIKYYFNSDVIVTVNVFIVPVIAVSFIITSVIILIMISIIFVIVIIITAAAISSIYSRFHAIFNMTVFGCHNVEFLFKFVYLIFINHIYKSYL